MTESDSTGPSSPGKGDVECKSSYRKSNKPLMEKRRRARINTCLGQLKTLVLQAMKKDNAQYSKLEKADILELTVKHLRTVQRHQMAAAMATSPDVINKYRAGFNECAGEVMRYLSGIPGINDDMRTRVISHLGNCIQTLHSQPIADVAMQQSGHRGIPAQHPAYAGSSCVGNQSAFQAMIKQPPSPKPGVVQMNTQCFTTPVQFIPGTLPSGQVALVLTSPSPVQAVPLYAAPAERRPETRVKHEAISPVPYERTVNPSPYLHPHPQPVSPGSAPSQSPVCPQEFGAMGVRPPTDESLWRPW